MQKSIRTRLTIAFIGLAVGPLLLVGVIMIWQNLSAEQARDLLLQHQTARRVATEVTAFIRELENDLRVVIEVRGLQDLSLDEQSSLLAELQAYNDVFETLVLLDDGGQELIRRSRLEFTAANDLADRSGAEEFIVPKEKGETYYSPVWFDETNGEPLMTIAIPLLNVRSGQVNGVLVADVRLKKIWDLIAGIRVSEGESVYIVDAQDRVVAHRNPSVVLRATSFEVPELDGLYSGLDSPTVILATDRIRLGEQDFAVVAEINVYEAFAQGIRAAVILGTVLILALVVAAGLALWAGRQIVRPIESLATASRAISTGDLTQQVEITSRDEIGDLAEAFNAMSSQLRELVGTLEQRVADRTERLEIVAILAERLSAILNLEELLAEVVNQVKDSFSYYHAHIYLLDETRQKLVVAAGTGQAGEAMKAKGHNIGLNAPTSLVARAARSGEVVNVDNVRVADDWLPNPLLPDTYSEMAVPIILGEQVVGVLDVQQDRVAGLDEGDASLLRSLANQVAVAIRNARLFEQVEQALTEARTAQERYIEQAWQKTQATVSQGQYLYANPEAAPLDEFNQQKMFEARQQAQNESGPIVVPMDNSDRQKSLVAPIQLRDKAIGAVQLYSTSPGQSWSEDDLAIIATVVDELAQAAENLRLFEETRERASFESLVGEINEKLRQAPTLDILAKTAAEALGNALGVSHSLIKVGAAPPPERRSAGNGKQG
jgi:GAF domain-containing protein/HAMP domain-containing protein